MKIIKYRKQGNGKYRLFLENDIKIDLYEEVIIKNNLLYKKEIDNEIIKKIDEDNNNYDIYNRCVKYIMIRLRSEKEIRDYIKKYTQDNELINRTIERLYINKLLDDEKFTSAFVSDKFKFSSMGPYMIEAELKKHHIRDEIIYEYINNISKSDIHEKMDKQINKIIKSTRDKSKLKHKIYTNLLRLGYRQEDIIHKLNDIF